MSENSELEELLTDDFIDFIDEFTEKSANPSSQPATISKNEIENELNILLEGLETPNSEDANECLERLTKNDENLDDFAAILKFAAEKCQKLEDQEKTFKPPVNRFDIFTLKKLQKLEFYFYVKLYVDLSVKMTFRHSSMFLHIK